MYPWPDPLGYYGSPVYLFEDLPDNITVDGMSIPKDSGVENGYGYYGGDPFVKAWHVMARATGGWAFYCYPSGPYFEQDCLIAGDGNYTPGDDTVEDQFEPTYALQTYDGYGTREDVTLARVSLCEWFVSFPSGHPFYNPVTVTLRYADLGSPISNPTWFLQHSIGYLSGYLDDHANDPRGTYSNGSTPVGIVS